MSKKNSQRSNRRKFKRSRKSRKVFILVLVLSLTTLGLVSASFRNNPFGETTSVEPPTAPPPPTGFEPSSPAKEYIYAGNRLVAIEEPVVSPTPTPTPPAPCTPPTGVIISEFRLRGALGASDEFIELYNTNNQPLTICTADSSSGWAVVSSDAVVRFIVPYNTTIPARGHYLAAGGGYSLGAYAIGDLFMSSDVPDNKGLALFNTSNPASFNVGNIRDAVGFTTDGSLYREGSGLLSIGTSNGEFSLARKLVSGVPQDTGDNASVRRREQTGNL